MLLHRINPFLNAGLLMSRRGTWPRYQDRKCPSLPAKDLATVLLPAPAGPSKVMTKCSAGMAFIQTFPFVLGLFKNIRQCFLVTGHDGFAHRG